MTTLIMYIDCRKSLCDVLWSRGISHAIYLNNFTSLWRFNSEPIINTIYLFLFF